MFRKHGKNETPIEDFQYKRTLQEHYIQREKESIKASRKVIVRERERLDAERYDLSQHLYEEVGQDLMALNEELDRRERTLAQREEQFAEQLPAFESEYALLVTAEYTERPAWNRVGAWMKEKTVSFFKDMVNYGLTIESLVMVMAMGAGIFSFVYRIFIL